MGYGSSGGRNVAKKAMPKIRQSKKNVKKAVKVTKAAKRVPRGAK